MPSLHIHHLTPSEAETFRAALMLFEKVFAQPHGAALPTEHLQSLLNEPHFSVFVAEHDANVVGALTAYTLPTYYTGRPFVYIFDVAIEENYQRQGIGSQLLDAVKAYGKEIGAAELFVQADLEDTHALEFYRKNGGEAESVVHFTYPLT